jgi:hypothetical protein
MNSKRHLHRFAADFAAVISCVLGMRHILESPALGVALMSALSV